MSFLFYYFFLPLCAGIVAAVSVWGLGRFLDLALLGFRKYQKIHFPQRRLRLAVETRVFLVGMLALSLLAIFVLGSPLLGLGGWILVPLIGRGWVLRAKSRHRTEIQEGTLPFFYTLRGLIDAGLSLPSALFEMTRSQTSSLARELQRELDRYEEGRSLSRSLGRFQERNPGGPGQLFVLLTDAYSKGLSLLPLLERILPFLEKEEQAFKKIQSLRASCLAQMGIVFLIPWLVVLGLGIFQPETASKLFEGKGLIVLGGALLVETLGGWVAWNLSRYY